VGYLIDLFKSTRPRDLLFFSGYALYLVFSYMVFHSTTVLSSASANAAQIQPLFLLASSGARVFVFLAIAFSIALSMRFLTRPSTTIASIATVAIALMSFVILGMVFQFSHYLSGSEYIPWLLLGGGLLGLADAIITLLWVRFSATLDLRTVYLFVLLSNALSLVLYFLVTLLPVSVSLPVAAALFIVAAVFAKKALDVSKPEQWEYSRPVFFGTLRTVSQPILGTAILFFLSGLMLQISGQKEIPLGEFQLISLLTSAAVVICLLLPALFIKKPLNLGRLFSVALPLSAAGFLLLPIIWNAAGGIVNSLAQLGSMVASIILWCLLVQIIQETRLHPYLLFGIAFACTDFALFAGSLIGFLNADTFTAQRHRTHHGSSACSLCAVHGHALPLQG